MSDRFAARVAAACGAPGATGARRVGGGDICDAYRVTLEAGTSTGTGTGGAAPSSRPASRSSSGSSSPPVPSPSSPPVPSPSSYPVFAKTLRPAPPGFFAAEAAGLALLAGTGTVAVPRVLAADEELLVMEWAEPGAPSPAQAERLGRELAALHGHPAGSWGNLKDGRDGQAPAPPAYLGTLPLPSQGTGPPRTEPEEWPDFHAEYRLRPFLRTAVDRGGIGPGDARDVERLCERIGQVAGPPQPPAVIHGDLWSGNVHWSADGRARLIDPAAQGGHPETDLALLRLFGCPELSRILAAYDEVRPGDGRAERVPLHQLQHLLVHAALFGAGYGASCGAAARAALGS